MSQVLTLNTAVPSLGGQPRGYTSQEWEAQRSEITRLYAGENIPLKDVVQIMKTKHSFVATERQYKTRIHQWGLDKKIKSNEMVAIVRIERKRKVEEGKETAFFVRKRLVDPRKISRFIKGHDIPNTRSQMSPTPSVISYRTIHPEALSIVSSEEGMVGPLDDSHGRIEPATTSVTREIVSSALVSVSESIQVPSAGLAEVAGSSTSFSRDLAVMNEIFDFSAAAKTDSRSTSSFRHLASIQSNPLSKQLCKSQRQRDITVTPDGGSDSTDLENLGSLVELAKKVEDQGKHEWSRVLLERVMRLVGQRIINHLLEILNTFVLGGASRNLRRQFQYYEADQLIETASGTLFYIGLGKSPEALLSWSVLDRATSDFDLHQQAIVLVRTALELARVVSDPDNPVSKRMNDSIVVAHNTVIEIIMKLQGNVIGECLLRTLIQFVIRALTEAI